MRSTRKWVNREKKILSHMGMKRQPMSGAGWLEKEDGKTSSLLCQLKSTEGQAISVRRDDVLTLLKHAQIERKIGVFALDFVDGPLLWCIRQEDVIKFAVALVNDHIVSIDDDASSDENTNLDEIVL